MKEKRLFGYVKCDLNVPDALKYIFSNFLRIFKNSNVSRAYIGDYMRDYAIDNNLLRQQQRILISSFNWRMEQSYYLYSTCTLVLGWNVRNLLLC